MLTACNVEETPHREREFVFQVLFINSEEKPLILQADSEQLMNVWVAAIKNSSKGIYGLVKPSDLTEYFDILEIPVEKRLNINNAELVSFFNRIAELTHPNNGGDLNQVRICANM